MTTKNNGGPAFPAHHFELGENEHGITLRDYFAAKAMQAILSSMSERDRRVADSSNDPPGYVAKAAYAVADAMLKVREA